MRQRIVEQAVRQGDLADQGEAFQFTPDTIDARLARVVRMWSFRLPLRHG
jgi:hypothetical protein